MKQNESEFAQAELELTFASIELDKFLGVRRAWAQPGETAAEAVPAAAAAASPASNAAPAAATNKTDSPPSGNGVAASPDPETASTGDEKGDREVQIQEQENKIKLARAELENAKDVFEWSEKLFTKDYITKNELERDRISSERARLTLELAISRMRNLIDFDLRKQEKRLRADVREAELNLDRVKERCEQKRVQAQTDLKSKERQLELEKTQLERIDKQIASGQMIAPQNGLVVYANESGRWRRGREDPISEGVSVRYHQKIITLPDVSEMIVEVSIHESARSLLWKGQQALIQVEALEGKNFKGTLVKVPEVPDSSSGWLTPDRKVYKTRIRLDNESADVRPGMSAGGQDLLREDRERDLRSGAGRVLGRSGHGFCLRQVLQRLGSSHRGGGQTQRQERADHLRSEGGRAGLSERTARRSSSGRAEEDKERGSDPRGAGCIHERPTGRGGSSCGSAWQRGSPLRQRRADRSPRPGRGRRRTRSRRRWRTDRPRRPDEPPRPNEPQLPHARSSADTGDDQDPLPGSVQAGEGPAGRRTDGEDPRALARPARISRARRGRWRRPRIQQPGRSRARRGRRTQNRRRRAMTLASLRGVCRHYRMGDSVVRALDGIDLEIEQGDYWAILGRSGSGKSTLLNLLGCLDRPTAGTYVLDGVDVSGLSDDALSHLRSRSIGFIFQSFNLIPQLTVEENIEVPLFYQGVSPVESRRRAQAIATRVGLSERLHHRPTELSGGQQQRVAIARALVNDPAIVLADEATGNLDSTTEEEILAVMDQLHAMGKTIILVTHNAALTRHAGHVLVLADGKVERLMTRDEIDDTGEEFL